MRKSEVVELKGGEVGVWNEGGGLIGGMKKESVGRNGGGVWGGE